MFSAVEASLKADEKRRQRVQSKALEGYVDEPPPRLRTLASVIDLTLELFGIMDEGIAPRVDRQVRYYFYDGHWGNTMLAEDGHLSLIDHELTVVCNSSSSGGSDARGPRPSRAPEVGRPAPACTPEMDRVGRFLSVHHLFLTFLMLLLRYSAPADVLDRMGTELAVVSLPVAARRFYGPRARSGCSSLTVGELPGDLFPLLKGRMWEPVWGRWPDGHKPGAGGGVPPTLQDAEAAADVLVWRMRTAFQRDWVRLPNSSQVLVAGLRAVEACDASWPPAFVERLRGLRPLLKRPPASAS